jgi:hypothetical protein
MRLATMVLGALAFAGAAASVGNADERASPARYDDSGRLRFPADYRTWVFLSSGKGMSYNPVANDQPEAPYDNVFADPAAYRAFTETGAWPDGTVLVLEIRGSTSHGSINKGGSFQSGEALATEVHVKDTARFGGDGWAFFGFHGSEPAEMIGREANCYACHEANTAVDRTFVQFYPTLLPIARAKGTLSANFLAAEAAEKGGAQTE